MTCPVCKGTGIMALPHGPGARGGWLDASDAGSGVDCRACNGSGARFDTASGARRPDDPPPPSAEAQLRDTRIALTTALRTSAHLPPDVAGRWLADLGALDVYRPETGLAMLSDLRHDFEAGRARYRPARDVVSVNIPASVTAETGFDSEMQAIDGHLAFLEALMEHAARTLGEYPEYRRD